MPHFSRVLCARNGDFILAEEELTLIKAITSSAHSVKIPRWSEQITLSDLLLLYYEEAARSF